MQIRSQSFDNGFPDRPSADITRANREAIHRTTAESAEKAKQKEPADAEPKTDPAKDVKAAREAARAQHDHRLRRARDQARNEHDHRLRRAREQQRDEHDVRLRNARAKAAAQPEIDVDPRTDGADLGRPEAASHAEDGLSISQAARALVGRANADERSRVEADDPARTARLAEIRSRMDRGELNTDELIARTAVRILSGEKGE